MRHCGEKQKTHKKTENIENAFKISKLQPCKHEAEHFKNYRRQYTKKTCVRRQNKRKPNEATLSTFKKPASLR